VRKSDDIRVHGLSALFTIMSEELSLKDPYDDKKSYAVKRLITRMRKRADSANDVELSTKAVSDFVKINSAVAAIRLSLPDQVVRDARHYITVVLERYTTSLDDSNIQETLDIRQLLNTWRFGPGASNGIVGTHAAVKINQPMSCTLSSVPLVSMLRRSNPYFQLNDKRKGSQGFTVIGGSRLTTVPKNEETHRTIAIEPSGNMALQLAAGRYLEDTLRYIGLDIRDQQPKNKAMALRGSLDGSVATIDLKSASDMVSIDLVRALLPVEWYWLLMKLRSPNITLPNGDVEELNMISTMGNGFTFPLMTFILVSLIYAYRCSRGGPNLFLDWSNTCVFGDDIILPSEEYDGFCVVLGQAGLLVNHEKSYHVGPFRESCGGDYYEGWDVTPFYVNNLRDDAAIYVALNQVLSWCARQEILLPNTIMYLASLLKGKVRFIPEWCNPDQGLLTMGGPRKYTYLQPVAERVRLIESDYSFMLAVGGYLTSVKSDLFYVPRLYKTRYKVRHARIPTGYLDGSYPLYRTARASRYVDVFVSLFIPSGVTI
jgi:hypothetical protein